ncbi:Glycoside hydrolase, catalytic domain-containing protein [Artemisia annua]|uniref:mannan endo-1,4-beta-mannosidase n=1 Tax=Artemisia annua TaxID=35608 RepID=A0A2U1KBJ7_ARTAN|nr:Glycoside hydrolase, catalytic domain-containing protein [Artemisia annua]
MDHAVHDHSRPRIRAMLQAAAKMGLTVCRTWAFNDGDYNALQVTPGQFDEKTFKALDYVIAEAREVGIRLMLSLVNNLDAYGGKTQYVKWAWTEGVGLSPSNDSFFYDPSIRIYFKNYVKTVLTRKNTITGIQYRDDPVIFGWELINEPRCITDRSGDTLQDWIEEMSAFIKSIDNKHLLTVGLEGFYGPKSPKRETNNPEFWAADMGVDFIRNSAPSTIDFASVHIYPDQWFKRKSLKGKLKFVADWMHSHIEDGDQVLKKPVMFTEFGLSDQNKGFDPSQRDQFYKIVFDLIGNDSAVTSHNGSVVSTGETDHVNSMHSRASSIGIGSSTLRPLSLGTAATDTPETSMCVSQTSSEGYCQVRVTAVPDTVLHAHGHPISDVAQYVNPAHFLPVQVTAVDGSVSVFTATNIGRESFVPAPQAAACEGWLFILMFLDYFTLIIL